MRLRIAQLANFVGPESGGMKIALEALGQGYVDAGHERILIIPGERDEIVETEAGIVATIASPKIAPTYRMILQPKKAIRLLEQFRPTSIEVSDKWTLTPTARWARKAGVGSVLFSHEKLDDMATNFVRGKIPVSAAVGWWTGRLAAAYDRVVVTSHYSAAEFASTTAELRLIPLGVDLDTFSPSNGNLPDDGITHICYVGRMSHEKDPQLGVAAAVELHRRGVPVQLHMYGTGADVDELKQLAGDAPVTFHGFVSGRTEVSACFASSHLSYSVSPHETFGLAVLEALASGTPVVTANRGGASELITEDCGEFAEPTPEDIADATERLIARLAPELRLAARKRAEGFSWASSVSTMLALHEEVSK